MYTDVVINVARVLRHCKRTDVPFYRGCESAILYPFAGPRDRYEGHGKRGLGEAPEEPESELPKVQDMHAANAIIKIARECAEAGNKLHIIALGPLTNLALASLIDPTFPSLLAGCTVMGSTLACQGNAGFASEFNFDSDPEAAQVVLARYGPVLPGGVRMMPWEMFPLTLPWADFNDIFFNEDKSNELAVWFRTVFATLISVLKRDGSRPGVYLPDPIAMVTLLLPESIKKETELYAVVETAGRHMRGAVAYDWMRASGKKPNCTLVQEMNYDVFHKHLCRVFCKEK